MHIFDYQASREMIFVPAGNDIFKPEVAVAKGDFQAGSEVF